MAFVIYSGEQDIEDNGISISMSVNAEKGDKPEEIFIHMVDNLLGVSEFLTNTGYDFADVGIDCQNITFNIEDMDFNNYLCNNKTVSDLFKKYVSCEIEEPMLEGDTLWYNFCLENIKVEMSEKDLAEFVKIFKGMVNERTN